MFGKAFDTYLGENQESYLDLLRRLVQQNSGTENGPGVDKVGDLVIDAFKALDPDFQVERIKAVEPRYGHHVVLTREGTGPHRIGLVSHLDTVYDEAEERMRPFHWRREAQEGRAYGPGTIDIKGGTVGILMLLDALKAVRDDVYRSCTWKVLFDAAEEKFAADFPALLNAHLPDGTLACLVFEAGFLRQNTFHLVTGRKGLTTFAIAVTGQDAHAGAAHSEGANAIRQMAEVVTRVEAMTDYARDLTFNVGVIRGGTTVNCVPREAVAEVEMRAFEPAVAREGAAGILGLKNLCTVWSTSGESRCRVTVEETGGIAFWDRRQPLTRYLFECWQATARELGYDAQASPRGGISDGNHTCERIPTLDGLGPSGDNFHKSNREYIEIGSMVPKAVLNACAICRLLEASNG